MVARMTARHRRITLAFSALGVLSLPCLPIIWLIGSQAVRERWHQRAFDADLWRRQELTKYDPKWPPRLCMVDDLLHRRILPEKTEAQVIELLGRPTNRMVLSGTSTCELSYYLGPERGVLGIDSETLCIEIGKDGKVSRQWIHRD
jgi:hypothetical protein